MNTDTAEQGSDAMDERPEQPQQSAWTKPISGRNIARIVVYTFLGVCLLFAILRVL